MVGHVHHQEFVVPAHVLHVLFTPKEGFALTTLGQLTLEFAPEAEQTASTGKSNENNPALEVAANAADRFRGLIIESGAGNIRRYLARAGLEGTELGGDLAHAHEQKLSAIALPTLIIHGEIDILVPPATANALRDLLTGTAPALEVIPHAGHNDLLWVGREQYLSAIERLVHESAHTA